MEKIERENYISEVIEKLNESLKGLGYEAFNINKECMQELPPSGVSYGIHKKNAWILFLTKDGKISDLQVYEVLREVEGHAEKACAYIELRMPKTAFSDFGNCLSDWDQWTLQDVLFKVGFQYGFVDRKTMIRCLDRLAYIQEWKDPLWTYLSFIR